MNKIFLLLITISTIFSPLNGFASGLVPELCTIGDRLVCYPVVDIGFRFDGAIKVADNSFATVYLENKPVATGILSASNYIGQKRTQGSAVITFDSPLILPKGNTYNLVVPKDVIYREEQPSISNDELSVEFTVPESLGEATPSIENGSTVEEADRIGFYFGIETASVENSKAILFREGVAVREYDCDVSWDWDLGYAGIDFGETIHFENGVHYSIKIPKGSVSALYRSDIVNDDVEVFFVGSYKETTKSIQYVWCSLFDNHSSDVLGEVKLYYNQPIVLSVNPIAQLYIESDNIIIKEVVPSISKENDQYVVTVDFENTPILPEKGYSIIIPEGTIVTEKGDVIVNSRNAIGVENKSGILEIKDTEYNINIVNGCISIDNTSCDDEIKMFSLDGRILYNAKSEKGSMSIPIYTSGIYLLSINRIIYKIVVKR